MVTSHSDFLPFALQILRFSSTEPRMNNCLRCCIGLAGFEVGLHKSSDA